MDLKGTVMAKEDEAADFSVKAIEAAERVFNMLWNSGAEQDLWHWIIFLVTAFIVSSLVLILLIKSFGGLVENLAKFIESYKSSGLPLWQNKSNKNSIKKRKQFCAVLEADLSYLAKAENWNDQYFTDLEAEVETEGGYYASALDKLRKKKSFGLRKERSLIQAITKSTERAMQLVGEPGSGKSVALRHLAKQLAERGRKSNDENAVVPLYINLREIELANKEDVNADSIREFILDNIRRGDADTSAFVRDNWQDYCSRGTWLFLFDSFDEIPAVLHAETGSDVIKKYSQALRHFLEGMGECKGILASREFKGPEALPWKKLRILPLSGEKQDELIRNSFLYEENLSMVRQHLANSHSSIGSTPLFLTLLCRYVRDECKPPNNDHDILFQHIDRLSSREPEYLLRKYNLSPRELVLGAERLARLFAEDDDLSLAPSLDQIRFKLPVAEIPGGSLENLISALVDSKIGRADVPNAAIGDRRFAFAHRRYQEALFVRYLTTHPEAISPLKLLTENRWREYTVTLLQTREYEEFSDLLSHASFILSECANQNRFNLCGTSPLPTSLGYYDWSNEKAIQLLSLLQEGLTHRLQDVPYSLNSAVSNFLKPRWEKGDSFDRNEVLRLGGLLPHDTLVKYLVEAFNNGTKSERLHAFRQTAFTQKLPENAKSVVLSMLSDQIIVAKDRAELLSIEALAARLPNDMGANVVVNRSIKLRRNFGFLRKVVPNFLLIDHPSILILMLGSIFDTPSFRPKNLFRHIKDNYQNAKPESDLSFISFLIVFSWIIFTTNLIKHPSNIIFAFFVMESILIIFLIHSFLPFMFRHYGKKVRTVDVIAWLISFLQSKRFIKSSILFFLAMGLFLLTNYILGYAVIWLVTEYFPTYLEKLHASTSNIYVLTGTITTLTILYAFLLVKISLYSKRKRSSNKSSLEKLNNAKQKWTSDISVVYSAAHYDELLYWLENDDKLLCDTHSIRVFSSYIQSIMRADRSEFEADVNLNPKCLSNKKTTQKPEVNKKNNHYRAIRQKLEDRLTNVI